MHSPIYRLRFMRWVGSCYGYGVVLVPQFLPKIVETVVDQSKAMASSTTYALFLLLVAPLATSAAVESPKPTAWPLQFHSILYVNYSGSLSLIDLWYDWTNGRNFNIIQDQLGSVLYDLEWNNGTSFFYTLDSTKKCSSAQLEVGILRPDWLDGAEYVGQESVDGFLCNVWQKLRFIWYYEDVVTKRPVHWVFYTGRSIHVMTFDVGAVLEDEKWQAPVNCFEKKEAQSDLRSEYKANVGYFEYQLKGILGGSMQL